MFDIGLQEMLVIGILALLVFGPSKMPELGRMVGRALREFRRASDGLLVDAASGSRFDRDGLCIEGPLEGKHLPPVTGVQAEWYGWFATYPQTSVFAIK